MLFRDLNGKGGGDRKKEGRMTVRKRRDESRNRRWWLDGKTEGESERRDREREKEEGEGKKERILAIFGKVARI